MVYHPNQVVRVVKEEQEANWPYHSWWDSRVGGKGERELVKKSLRGRQIALKKGFSIIAALFWQTGEKRNCRGY